MAKYKSDDIRNIVLCGHAGAGKTILAEAILLQTKMIKRLGTISDGTTTSDYDEDEQARGHSLVPSVLHASIDGKEFNIIDTPGATDFIGGMVSGIAGADMALICINAVKGIELMARKAWEYAGHFGLGRMIVITRMDDENVNYPEVIESIRNTFGTSCTPFIIPTGEGANFSGVVRVLAEGAVGEGVEELKTRVTENAVECDDELMTRYLEGGVITHDEVVGVLQRAIAAENIVPIFAVAAEKGLGVEDLMHGVAEWGTPPAMSRRKMIVGKEEKTYTAQVDGPLCAQVFKVVSDAHVGKVSYVRVFGGVLHPKDGAIVSSTGKAEKIPQLYRSQGEKREEMVEAIAGDIVAITKVDALHVGTTLSGKGIEGMLQEFPFPTPMAGLAVSPKARGDEQKLSTYMHRLCEEDPTFHFERDELTHEQVVRGVGQLHLDVMLGRLKHRFGLGVNTKPPKIPYLETIAGKGEGSYRHKKQSGGSGQFGEVHIRLKPNERGAGFEFVNGIVGGVISGTYVPSVEKGVRKALVHGPVAGYPMVDVVCELFFGKEHPVDSKDIAFQIAGEMAFKEIVQSCKPCLLEPVVNMEIVFPAAYFGDISGDISTRRGRPTGTDQIGDMQVLKAQVPLAEAADYGSILSGITQGEGFFSMELSHYDPVPSNIAQQVAAKAKAAAETES